MKILIASPVRQTEEIFDLFYKSLERLKIPEGCKVEKYFFFHNSPELKKYCVSKNHFLFDSYEDTSEYTVGEKTHNGTEANLSAVVEIKNFLIRIAVKDNYDAVFFVDSDLILAEDTLERLVAADKDIISQVFWTKGMPEMSALPNSGDVDKYTFEDFEKYKGDNIIKVGMTGACTLIKRKVLDAGVDFSNLNNLRIGGEDRWFCIRAEAHGFEIFTDLRNPAYHIYRPSDIEGAKKLLNL